MIYACDYSGLFKSLVLVHKYLCNFPTRNLPRVCSTCQAGENSKKVDNAEINMTRAEPPHRKICLQNTSKLEAVRIKHVASLN